ncbi:MAG: hypothetical protein GY754_03040 [bacterium]|nr:hypothetical protein [bacterium]
MPKEDLARFKSLVQVFFLRNIKDPVKKYGVMGSVIQLEPGSFIVSLEALDISNINVRTVIFVKNKQVSSIQEISPALLDLSKDAISEIKLRDKK